MAFEIDHLFVLTSAGAPEADQLLDAGLVEGSPNRHVGQGTQNRRFFFHGSMLELLWVSDEEEARAETARRTTLWDRWQDRCQNSPHGICLRRTSGRMEPPFSAWQYRPDFLPSDQSICIAEDAPLIEPLWFFMTQPPSAADEPRQEPIEHPLGVRELTAVHVVIPEVKELSEAARSIIRTGLVTMEAGSEHVMELTFDYDDKRQRLDFRPDLPIILRW